MFAQDDAIKIDRAAIIVNRGWIPARYRDKRSRPTEQNQRKLVKLTGCYMPAANPHDYKTPNDPDSNEWTNLCLEDIGIYWDLPNFDEAKWYYFKAVQFKGDKTAGLEIPTPASPDTPDDLIESHYKWRWHERSHQLLYRTFGTVSAVSAAVAMLAL